MQTPIQALAWHGGLLFLYSETKEDTEHKRQRHQDTSKWNNPNATKKVTLGRRKKLINNSGIPQHEIEKIARCIFPDILAYYESEEGQQEFAEWKRLRERKDNKDSSGDEVAWR